jgi:hypothetical protein
MTWGITVTGDDVVFLLHPRHDDIYWGVSGTVWSCGLRIVSKVEYIP